MAFETRESVTIMNQHQKIFGVLHLPLGTEVVPAVIFCHGLGGDKSGRNRLYVLMAEALSKKGIASLRIDFRGAGDSEGDLQDMTIESQLSDTMAALNYLKSHPRIRHDKIGLFGRSFGGVIALLAAEKLGNASSLALWAPLYDGEQWIERWKRINREGLELSDDEKYELMTVNGITASMALYSQLFQLKTHDTLAKLNKVPLLHIYGEKDTVIDPGHSKKYAHHRGKAVAESKFIVYPETDHDFTHPQEQKEAMQETLEWFCRTLK